MGEDRRHDDEPPILVPKWYVRLRSKGRENLKIRHPLRSHHASYLGMETRGTNWMDVQKGRRSTRRFFTGKFRAPSVIQAVAMIIGGLFSLVIFAAFLTLALEPAFHESPTVMRAMISFLILLSGIYADGLLVNGIASVVERSWRYDQDETSESRGVEELNPLGALFSGQLRTRKPLYIFAQVAIGTALILPMLVTVAESILGMPMSLAPSPSAAAEDQMLMVVMLIIPLFVIGGMFIINGALNIWRIARSDERPSNRRDDDN